MIEIREVRREDYKKARQFAIQGMHLDWYVESKTAMEADEQGKLIYL